MNRAARRMVMAGCAYISPGRKILLHVRKRRDPGEGRVTLGQHSILRKRHRAMRRGLLPNEDTFRLGQALAKAHVRRKLYANNQRFRAWTQSV